MQRGICMVESVFWYLLYGPEYTQGGEDAMQAEGLRRVDVLEVLVSRESQKG